MNELLDFGIVCLKSSPLYLGLLFLFTGNIVAGIASLALYGVFLLNGFKKLAKEMKEVERRRDEWFRSLPFWKRRELEERAKFNLGLLRFGLLVVAACALDNSGEEALQAELEASQAIHNKINGRTR